MKALTCWLVLAIVVATAPRPLAQQHSANGRPPTIDDLLTLKSAGGTQISPDGKWVAYAVTETDFKQDAYVTHLWLANTASGKTFQVTRGEKGVGGAQWSPDGAWLSFTSNRVGDKNQIFVLSPEGGEALQLTKAESSVGGFSWSPDGKRIAFTAADAPPPAAKDRRDHLGDFEVVRREYAHTHLWSFDVAEAMKGPVTGKRHTKNKDFSVSAFSWSPDATKIAFSATVNPDLIQGRTADIYVLSVADDKVTTLVSQPGPDGNPNWSPDGRFIVFSSAMGQTVYFASNSRLALVPAEGGTPRSITDRFDENPSFVEWNKDGLYFSGLQKTASHLFRVDPGTGAITRISGPDDLMAGNFSFTRDGRRVAFSASSPTSLNEVLCQRRGELRAARVDDDERAGESVHAGLA